MDFQQLCQVVGWLSVLLVKNDVHFCCSWRVHVSCLWLLFRWWLRCSPFEGVLNGSSRAWSRSGFELESLGLRHASFLHASSLVSSLSSSLLSKTKPNDIAITFPVVSSSSASQQKARNLSKPDAIVKLATLSRFPSGICILCFPPPQNFTHSRPLVCSPYLSRSGPVVFVCDQCCGLKRRTRPSGTY